MIFQPIERISDKSEMKFFVEKIDVYIRLVEVACQKWNFAFSESEIPDIDTLIKIGVIINDSGIEKLKKQIKDKTSIFFRAVNTVVENNDAKLSNVVAMLNNSERKKLQSSFAERKELTLVDFFCGAGGLSLGFRQVGFNIKLANDIEDVCIETYKLNHPEIPGDKIIKGDIKNIVDNITDYVSEDIDVVVGGPPCQGFSEANRQRVIDDPRNKLYKYFVAAVEKIAPKFVIMENVKGMLKVAEQVVEDYGKLRTEQGFHYIVSYRILNSQNFSVAQSRERLIYIAIRSDVAKKKNLTPEIIFDDIERSCVGNQVFNLQDALEYIKPLEAPRIKNMNEVDSDITGKKIDVNEYSGRDNEYLTLINQGREIPFLFNHKARYCSDVNYEIYKRLNQGDDATDEKIKDIMPYAHRNHCFKDKYYKLIADRPCRTITAHLRMDCHSHIHPFQVRSLTPREAARVQSFPDDYLFMGPYLKTYMQIGNAVPTMMARGIAKVIKAHLCEGGDAFESNTDS